MLESLASDGESFRPFEAAKHLGIAENTLRVYAARFASLLSPGASGQRNAAQGVPTKRLYTPSDIRLLARAKDLVSSGGSYDEALAILRAERPSGQRGGRKGVSVASASRPKGTSSQGLSNGGLTSEIDGAGSLEASGGSLADDLDGAVSEQILSQREYGGAFAGELTALIEAVGAWRTLAEERGREVGELNRRLDGLAAEKAREVSELYRKLDALDERRAREVGDLERKLEALTQVTEKRLRDQVSEELSRLLSHNKDR